MQRIWQQLWQQRVFSLAAMFATANPFRALDQEWASLGTSRAARTALKRWSAAEPVLAGFDSPAQVVALCQRRDDRQRSGELLGAMLRLADQELAARTVLQAVLPSLAARAWRGARWARVKGERLEDAVEELNAELLVAALERIRELAGTNPAWPAQAIVDVPGGGSGAIGRHDGPRLRASP